MKDCLSANWILRINLLNPVSLIPLRSILCAALLGLPLFLVSCMHSTASTHQASTQAAQKALLRTIEGNAPEVLLEGRIDTRQRGGPILIWQGSSATLNFTGSSLVLHFDQGVDQSHFLVEVDGTRRLVSLKNQATLTAIWPLPLAATAHTVRITKQSEAAAGHARLRAFEVAQNSFISKPKGLRLNPKLLFIGDSITVGACNEDGAEDQWDDRSTHNNTRSYGALTARGLNADYRCIAVSGMGVCEGYVPLVAGEAWNRLYPVKDAPLAPAEAGWEADVIFVNLGENDSSFTQTNQRPFPADFTKNYVQLIADIRAANPEARIVLLRGGMGGGATNPSLRKAWDEAVVRIAKVDTSVSHFVFQHWSALHPRVADDEAMAEELHFWLLAQPWFQRLQAR